MSTDRIGCCVPFCRRTTKREGCFADAEEYVCGRHWPLVPKRVNDLRPEAIEAVGRVWRRCKRYAIETAIGL